MTEASTVLTLLSFSTEAVVQALTIFGQTLTVLTFLARSTEFVGIQTVLVAVAFLAEALAVLAFLPPLAEGVGVVGGGVAVASLVDALAVLALLPRPALPVRDQSILIALATRQKTLTVCIALVPTWTE